MKVNGFYNNREGQMKLQGYELKKKLWAILKAYYLPKTFSAIQRKRT